MRAQDDHGLSNFLGYSLTWLPAQRLSFFLLVVVDTASFFLLAVEKLRNCSRNKASLDTSVDRYHFGLRVLRTSATSTSVVSEVEALEVVPLRWGEVATSVTAFGAP